MIESPAHAARQRVQQLADDPATRPFVVGYLLSCLDERHWEALAEAAVSFAVENVRLQREAVQAARRAAAERG